MLTDPFGLDPGNGDGRKDPAPVSTVPMPTAAPQSPPPRSASSFGGCAAAIIGVGLLTEGLEGFGAAGIAAAAEVGVGAVILVGVVGLLVVGSAAYVVYSQCFS